MKKTCGALVGGLLLVAVAAPARQVTFRTSVDVVRVDALVTQDGKPFAGLSAEDFELEDNGVRQKIDLVTTAVNLNLVLALDTSSSVEGEELARLKDACRALLRELRAGDTASLLTFSDRIELHANAERDPTVVERALQKVRTRGMTSLLDAVYTGISLAVSDTSRSVLLVFTDGGENWSFLTEDDLMQSLRRSSVVVYAVGTMDPRTAAVLQSQGSQTRGRTALWVSPRPRELLEKITRTTSGSLEWAEYDERLAQTFVKMLREFRSRYLLTFTPQGVGRNDGWHKLTVKVKGRNLAVKARSGYWAK